MLSSLGDNRYHPLRTLNYLFQLPLELRFIFLIVFCVFFMEHTLSSWLDSSNSSSRF